MKRSFLLVPIFLMTACLSGCSPQLTAETFTHEAGEELSTDVTKYATFKKPEKAAEATLDLSNVVADKVGTYEATITLKNKEYPFTVEVVDTTAPDGKFANYFVAKNSAIVPDDYGISVNDCSEFKVGFAESEHIKKPDEIATVFQELISMEEDSDSEQNEEASEFDFVKMFELAWDESIDSREVKEYDSSNLADSFEPEEDGLYRLELVAADVHGNATIMNAYALIDTTPPEIKGADDVKYKINANENVDKYIIEGITITDNMMGDIIHIDFSNRKDEILEQKDLYVKAKSTFTGEDLLGNVASAERIIEFEIEPKVEAKYYEDGFYRAWAEEAFALVNQQRAAAGLNQLAWDEGAYNFACTRAQEIVNNFSHYRPDGTFVVDSMYAMGYNGNGENLGRYGTSSAVVNSWMNSPTHRDNILKDYFNAAAVACYIKDGVTYWVNIFRC